MNRERLIELAGVIERERGLFLQTSPGHGRDPRVCSSPCCTIGWAYVLWGRSGRNVPDATVPDATVRDEGFKALGLTFRQGMMLWSTAWPAEWYRAAGVDARLEEWRARDRERYPASTREIAELLPRQEEAAAILKWIAGLPEFPMLEEKAA